MTHSPEADDEASVTTTSVEVLEPIRPDECSVTWITELPEVRTEAYSGLPPAVESMRMNLVDAASNCDFQGLVELMGDPSPARTALLGYAEDPLADDLDFEKFVRLDERTGLLRSIALALTTLPFGAESADYESDGGTGTTTYYVWPPQPQLIDSNGEVVSITEVWDREFAARVGEVNGLSLYDVYNFTDQFGSYILWSVAIREDGQAWLSYSGDRNHP